MNDHYYTQYAAVYYQDWRKYINFAYASPSESEKESWQPIIMKAQAQYVMALALKI